MKYLFFSKLSFKSFYSALLAAWALMFSFHSAYAQNKDAKVVVAYLTSWTQVLPDPSVVTHINYAFAHVNDSFNGLRIDNTQRLEKIVALKQTHPELKVLLSVGGWGSGRFSEMAADDNLRTSFAKDCARVVDQFNLDGIDIDWEYPTSKAAGISASDQDTDNFTLLMKDIRKAIGNDKLLTLASVASGQYIDFAAINQTVDFVNIMTYDSGNPPSHHAALYRSEHSGGVTCQEAVANHIAKGMPADKLVLGIPFYGRGDKDQIDGFIDYKKILKLSGYQKMWDDIAKADYLVDSNGKFVLTFETPESIALKCAFAHAQGLKGAMYWEYAGDTEDGVLSKAVWNGIFNNQN